MSIISFFLYVGSVFALSSEEFPDSCVVKSDPTFFVNKSLITGDQQIGLLTLAPNKKGTFYYFDDQNQLQNTVVLIRKNFSLLEFEVLDQYQKVVAYFDIRCNSIGLWTKIV